MNYTPSLPHIKALNFVREKCPLFLLSWLPGSAVLSLLFPNFWRTEGQGNSYCSVVHYVYLGETEHQNGFHSKTWRGSSLKHLSQ